MYGKLLIKADLEVVTGLHIGGPDTYSAIGAIDSPVVKDPLTHLPIVPGSSLKGKLRTLLVCSRSSGDDRHVPKKDDALVRRLFGCEEPVQFSRLQFADAFVTNARRFEQIGLTEIKSENAINRLSSVANPRQIERVVPGVIFGCRIVYTVDDEAQLTEDMTALAHAMRLLQLDYLGGHGSRGSGRVSFRNIRLEPVACELPGEKCRELSAIFEDVEKYDLLAD